MKFRMKLGGGGGGSLKLNLSQSDKELCISYLQANSLCYLFKSMFLDKLE